MKRWQWIVLCAAVLAGPGYWFYGRNSAVLERLSGAWSGLRARSVSAPAGKETAAAEPAAWQTVERPDEGFRIDLPADARDLQVPAYNETGGSEPVKMLVSVPDGDTTFAVSWQDNPPVARVNQLVPERTLEMARDGMLKRTQTTLSSDSVLVLKGYPAREFTARNGSGGVLNARLIFAGERLYTLMALFPSESARRERDVKHFFNSFQPAGRSAVTASLPAASTAGE